jgi:glycosyltransferase involved in cell wall biosynthesis
VRGDTEPPSAAAATATPRATVIVPAFNEEGGLAAVLNELRDELDENIEILVVDDGSTDRTASVAEAAGARLVRHPRNRGKGAALRTGLEHAAGERIVVIDADGTYPVREIGRMLDLLDTHDLVLGARRVGRANIPRVNRLGNAIFSTGIRTLSGLQAADPLTGLYATWRRHLQAMQLRSDGFGIETEITMKSAAMGLATADHAIPYGSRVGRTKLRPLRDGTAIALTMGRLGLARLLRRRPPSPSA